MVQVSFLTKSPIESFRLIQALSGFLGKVIEMPTILNTKECF